jgi:hypothetical protein
LPPVSATSRPVTSCASFASDWSTEVTCVLPVSTSNETIGTFWSMALQRVGEAVVDDDRAGLRGGGLLQLQRLLRVVAVGVVDGQVGAEPLRLGLGAGEPLLVVVAGAELADERERDALRAAARGGGAAAGAAGEDECGRRDERERCREAEGARGQGELRFVRGPVLEGGAASGPEPER